MAIQVEIHIRGLHTQDPETEQEELETVVQGEYYRKNDWEYILFQETDAEDHSVTKSMLKLKEDKAELTRNGTVHTHMCFEAGKEWESPYRTPFGEMKLGIRTEEFAVIRSEHRIRLRIRYGIAADGQKIADNHLSVTIRSQEPFKVF